MNTHQLPVCRPRRMEYNRIIFDQRLGALKGSDIPYLASAALFCGRRRDVPSNHFRFDFDGVSVLHGVMPMDAAVMI